MDDETGAPGGSIVRRRPGEEPGFASRRTQYLRLSGPSNCGYRVLRLEGGGGLRFLVRSDADELFGVYARNAQMAFPAVPLGLKLTTDNSFPGFDFFETAESALLVRC
jgi:hypothetical protein